MEETVLFNVFKRFNAALDLYLFYVYVEGVRFERGGLVIYLNVYDDFIKLMESRAIEKYFKKLEEDGKVERCIKAIRDSDGRALYEVPIYRIELGVESDYKFVSKYRLPLGVDSAEDLGNILRLL